VLWFSLQGLSETFLILRRIQRDIVISVLRSSYYVPALVVRFESRVNFLDRFSKHTLISNFMKICPVGVEFFHAGGRRTDGYDEANSRFTSFFESALKKMVPKDLEYSFYERDVFLKIAI